MNTIPRLTVPDDAPFSASQRVWLKGFLDGLSASWHTQGDSPAATAQPSPGVPVSILWGSQTGNSEALAKRLSKHLTAAGHQPLVKDMAGVSPADIASMRRVLIITSTYGDGEPPDNAAALHGDLANGGVDLSTVTFAVLALGDSNYSEFCKCGHDFHHRLVAAGAAPLLPVATCDVEFDEVFAKWSSEVAEKLNAAPVLA